MLQSNNNLISEKNAFTDGTCSVHTVIPTAPNTLPHSALNEWHLSLYYLKRLTGRNIGISIRKW